MPSLQAFAGALGRKNAAHLLRRASLGPTLDEIDRFAGMTANQAVQELLQPPADAIPPKDPRTGSDWNNPKANDANSGEDELTEVVLAWWINRIMNDQPRLTHRMTWFLHTHFTTMRSRVRYSTAIYHQIGLFYFYALGNFKTLSKKICYDNAMLEFLDGRLNEKGRPQENYAREFFELYTIGKGEAAGPEDYTTFTEQDVIEAARVLSGYKDDRTFNTPDEETGIPMGALVQNGSGLATRHDAGIKTFSARFGGRTIAPAETVGDNATVEAALGELDELVDMIFEQEETARHIVRRLYRALVYYKIPEEVEQDIIIPLANTFRNNDYELAPVLEQLLTSQHFYDADNATETDDNVGAIIKSPLELVMGIYRFFEVPLPLFDTQVGRYMEDFFKPLLRELDDQGLPLYDPFEVAGYPAYHQQPDFHRNWISANNLATRYNFSNRAMMGIGENMAAKLDILKWVEDHIPNPEMPETIVRTLIDHLFPEVITDERFDFFFRTLLLDTLSEINWMFEWQAYKQSGDDTAIRTQLEKLLTALLQSPEYQLA